MLMVVEFSSEEREFNRLLYSNILQGFFDVLEDYLWEGLQEMNTFLLNKAHLEKREIDNVSSNRCSSDSIL